MTWSLIYLLSEWLIRIVMIPVVMRRRPPSVAMAWLLVIFFQPWAGLLIYLLIGEPRLPRRRIRRHARSKGEIAGSDKPEAATHRYDTTPAMDPEHRGLVTLAERLGEMPILGANAITIMTRTRDVIDRLIADIDAAEHHVHMLFYIFNDDETGRRVSEALARAAGRGVMCRVLADAVGSWRTFKTLGPWLLDRGVDLRAALPVNPFRRRLARMDLRNHRKLVIIDGRVAYAGSHNIIDPTYGTRHLTWYDVSARLRGPIVPQLQGIFAEDWLFDTDEALDDDAFYPEPEPAGDVAIQALPSGPTYPTEGYHRLALAAIHTARRRLVITTPYFVPDDASIQALQVAVLRGVRVDLIMPAVTDQRLTASAGRAYYEQLLEMGVNLHIHNVGLLHAKTMTVDDSFALLGSANFDIRSFYLNFELNLLLFGPRVLGELRAAQAAYIEESEPLTLTAWRGRPMLRRLGNDVAKLFSPLL